MGDECGICTDPYNKTRKAVECPSCELRVCTRCIKTYLINNTIESKCMGCQSAWNIEFIRENLSKSFMDFEYKKHQISMLLSQAEASLLGKIQRFVPLRNRLDQLIKEIKIGKTRIESIRGDIGGCHGLVQESHTKKDGFACFQQMTRKKRDHVIDLLWNIGWTELSHDQRRFYDHMALLVHHRLEDKRAELHRIRRALDLHQKEKQRLEGCWVSGQLPNGGITESTVSDNKSVFFMACPRKDCRGRVSSVYKCGLCEHWACPDCHGDKGIHRNGPHECRQEDQETVQMLKQNTKNCPECHEGIFKEYGCDQMWCTRCQTCFSWNTGKKLTGRIHNPHYYEYLFQNNAQRTIDGDIEIVNCNDFNDFPEYNRLVQKWSRQDSGITREDQTMLNNIHRLTNHVRYVDIPGLHTTIADHETMNSRKWGVEYLRNNITREEWGQKLYIAYRKKEREQRITNIMEMFVMVSCNVYQNWCNNNNMTGVEMIESLCRVIEYANENIRVCNKQYGTKTSLLDPSIPLSQHILDYHRQNDF